MLLILVLPEKYKVHFCEIDGTQRAPISRKTLVVSALKITTSIKMIAPQDYIDWVVVRTRIVDIYMLPNITIFFQIKIFFPKIRLVLDNYKKDVFPGYL